MLVTPRSVAESSLVEAEEEFELSPVSLFSSFPPNHKKADNCNDAGDGGDNNRLEIELAVLRRSRQLWRRNDGGPAGGIQESVGERKEATMNETRHPRHRIVDCSCIIKGRRPW